MIGTRFPAIRGEKKRGLCVYINDEKKKERAATACQELRRKKIVLFDIEEKEIGRLPFPRKGKKKLKKAISPMRAQEP